MMMKRSFVAVGFLCVLLATVAASDDGCTATPPTSSSGLTKANVTVQPGSDGLSVEQRNVRDRLVADNKPGSIKHLYVISAYSGQVLIYSTVRGKVTSSGKRLAPSRVEGFYNNDRSADGFAVRLGDVTGITKEVLGDDGTYGDSVPYIYWFDAKGAYHQHYVDGGQIVHISDQPLAVKSIVLNMELEQDGK